MTKEEFTAKFYEQNKAEINALARSLYDLSFGYGKSGTPMVFYTDFGKIGIIKYMI